MEEVQGMDDDFNNDVDNFDNNVEEVEVEAEVEAEAEAEAEERGVEQNFEDDVSVSSRKVSPDNSNNNSKRTHEGGEGEIVAKNLDNDNKEEEFPRPAVSEEMPPPKKKKKMQNVFAKQINVGSSPAKKKLGALDYIVKSTPERTTMVRQSTFSKSAKKKVKGSKRIL